MGFIFLALKTWNVTLTVEVGEKWEYSRRRKEVGTMGRPKKNPSYDPDRARDELVKAVSDFYLNPPKEDFKGKDGK